MPPLDRIPTEILTQCLSHLEGRDLLGLLSVSSGFRAIASQNILWEPLCDRIYNKGTNDVIGWRPIHELDLFSSQNKPPYHLIWRRLALVEPYIGWWLSLDESPVGIILHIWLDNQSLVVSHIIPVAGPSSSEIPQTLAIGNTMEHIFALSSHGDFLNPLFIDAQSIILEQWSTRQSIQWFYEGPSRIMHQKYTLQAFHTHTSNRSVAAPGTQYLFPSTIVSRQEPPYMWPFRSSPSLFNAILHSGVFYDDQGYASVTSVPTISLPRPASHRPYVSVHSPFEEAESSALIAEGAWVASYGDVHGCEFIHVHIRRINEHDINGRWGDERTLANAVTPDAQDVEGLFQRPTIPFTILSSQDIQVGKTIIEAIKITGDVNVPRGVRTFVGFINHKLTWRGPSENGDLIPRPASHPWPLVPESEIRRGVPAAALPASLEEMKAQDVPARGMTMPGIMRVSSTGFSDPNGPTQQSIL